MPPVRPRSLAPLIAPALIAAVTALTGCSADHSGSFDAQAGTPSPTCLQHQTRTPGTPYTAGESADPRAVLEMMRYYTANGTKHYCDGKPPTDTDQRWTALYRTLGGDPERVKTP
ncbi:hypothetical protein [Kitasatospora sp. NPDC059571]|uniref:hypothetical protein n=1 Tax=Kitasatospora sp. NPDC059571 TaxID=3346871 RepID=UPI0036B78E0B